MTAPTWATVRESVASVCMSHPDGCVCLVCRANNGEPDAMAEVLAMIERDPNRRPA